MRGVTIGCGESLSDKQFCKITLGRARTTILIVTCKSLYVHFWFFCDSQNPSLQKNVSLHPPTLDTTNGLNFIPSIHHYCPFLKWSNIEGALWCSKSWSESLCFANSKLWFRPARLRLQLHTRTKTKQSKCLFWCKN
jgi:hypothetical protein